MAVYVSNRMANDPLILLSKEDDGKSCEWHEQSVAGGGKELKRSVLTSRLSLDIGLSSNWSWGEPVTCLQPQQPRSLQFPYSCTVAHIIQSLFCTLLHLHIPKAL